MKLQNGAFLLVVGLLPGSLGLDAPIEGYGVAVPEWEIEVTPGGPAAVLNGTIEEIHEELLQLNPSWDEEYMSNSTDTAGVLRSEMVTLICLAGPTLEGLNIHAVVDGRNATLTLFEGE
ncbi:hypothetical protein CEP52_017430 [Fusarium oligoseptatum]|uniref:Uncharacterized protein n=1 Tax=Fusarium oligoseptatum TaxID=2604345 RepID=A0A428RRF3_9HYPO|nr:hypothetical protein CEP52_017430 [Fusarium oligoseptatum]